MARTGDAIYLYGKSWWLNCHIQGVRYQRLLGVGISRSVALKHAQAIRVAVWSGEFGKATKAKDVSFEEASKHFEDWATANKKPRRPNIIWNACDSWRRRSQASASARSPRFQLKPTSRNACTVRPWPSTASWPFSSPYSIAAESKNFSWATILSRV